jgi:hypothetical protein
VNCNIQQANQCLPQKHRGTNFPALFSLAALAVLLFAACAEPVPLHGTWADNKGNTISFFDDESFNAALVNDYKETLYFDGTYTVLQNVLTLNNSTDNQQIVTEWDIRGNVLYLDWPTEEESIHLTLYKVAN